MAKNKKILEKIKGQTGFLAEFKAFISRGNVIDLAVGIIIGTAFTAIVTSVVNDLLMPVIGMILAGLDFKNMIITIPWGNQPKILIGNFIQAIINFLIVAACVFVIVKLINTLAKKKEETAKETEPEVVKPTAQELLLTEIRDLLKENANKS